jgi:acetolactate synthase-1/2/3 large subunit
MTTAIAGQPAGASRPRVVDVFLRYLLAEEARVVFGIPGGLLHPFFEAVEASESFELIVTKHEQGAAFMADGYARATGRISVCGGTSGPGATNLLTGVACAFADGVPMLVVTGQAASHALGKGAAQETNREDMDIVAMFRPVTKYSTMVTSAASVPHHLRRALRQALTGRPGPVHLNMPVDLWEMELDEEDWFAPDTYRPRTTTFDRKAVQQAAQHLFMAEYPVFLAGSGLRFSAATDLLLTLAEMLPARVATTPRGKGIFPENHNLSMGVLGFAGHDDARKVVLGPDTDVLFTVGASLNETTTFNWSPLIRPSKALLQLDIDADRIGRNYPVDVALVGDAHAILVELVYHLHRLMGSGSPRSQWPYADRLRREHERHDSPALRVSDQVPVTPQRWRADLQEVLPSNAIVFSDIGGHMLFNINHLVIGGGQSFLLNLGFGSMGHGTAGPVGAALGEKDRPIFAIIGDACFTMNGLELLTAVEYDTPVIWVVENNNMHGITWHGSQLVGSRRPLDSVRYRRPLDIAAMARAMGLAAWKVDRPGQIQPVIREALSLKMPSVVEVRPDVSIPPPIGERAQSIAGFIRQ